MRTRKDSSTSDSCGVRIVHTARVQKAKKKAVPESRILRLAVVFKVLGDPTRLKIVTALQGGVSPGAALVFLLAGPATNITSLTVLIGLLGRRATAIYLFSIAASCVGFGLLTDQIYALTGLSAKAAVGQASEFMPDYGEWAAALLLLILSIKPVYRKLRHLKEKNRCEAYY